MRIAFNPSPIDDTIVNMDLSMVTWLIINETEGLGLTGEEKPELIVGKLLSKYPKMAVLLALEEEGSVYCQGGVNLRQKAYRYEVKDTTAAGISVSREGAVPSIPGVEEVRKTIGGKNNVHTTQPGL